MNHISPPSILRCLAVLMAVWSVHGFRPNFTRHLLITRGAERYSYYKMHMFTVLSTSGDILEGTEKNNITGLERPTMETDERPWLGVGPDPMAEARRNLPSALRTTSEVACVENGDVKENGVRVEEVWLNGPFKAPFPPQPVEMLYLDDDIVVVNKASGLLCVPGRLDKDSLATRVALKLGHYRVDRMIVHRLDMATSGVVVMARSEAALKDLNRQFRDREVRKRYVAVVKGILPADEGEIDLPLCRNTGCPPLHMVNHVHGKPSLTLWRVLERAADRTRVEIIPVSGRSHQLRLHMDAIGHPILGDHFYGTKESLAMADRCLLHARTLCLRHPITGESMRFTAPCAF